jgi:hypothetical protein
MNFIRQIVLIILFASSVFCFGPPKIVSTSPAFWAIDVNSTQQKTVSVTFDQPMRPGFSSWLGRSAVAPDSISKASISADHLTQSVAVGLDAGKVYVLTLNEKSIPGIGFQNEKGIPLASHFLVFQTAGTLTSDSAPPRIIRSVPSNGTQEIDYTRVAAISVTFDQPMNPKKHGLHLYENNQLVDLSKISFSYSADGKTFTLPYTFTPATVYKLELNSTTDIGFARTTRIPLWPAKISFSTR